MLKRTTNRENQSLSVSVIIPTYNRKPLLQKCLEAAAALDSPGLGYEIIVVDDGSTDGTEELATQTARSARVPLTYIKQENRGPAAARNKGAQNARGEILAFLDDDCVPGKNWLVELMKGFSGERTAGVGGRTLPVDTENIVARYCAERKIIGAPIVQKNQVLFLITSNAAFRRDLFEAVGGFSLAFPKPGGEDLEICLRLLTAGYAFSYVPEAVVLHHHKNDFLTLCRTFANWGSGWCGVSFLHSGDARKDPLLEELFPEVYRFSALFYTRLFLRKELGYLLRFSFSNAFHFYGLRHSFRDALFFTTCDWAVRFSHLFGYLKGCRFYRKLNRRALPANGSI
jgi:glycosyltransferase involved in cell wall biosynthesis